MRKEVTHQNKFLPISTETQVSRFRPRRSPGLSYLNNCNIRGSYRDYLPVSQLLIQIIAALTGGLGTVISALLSKRSLPDDDTRTSALPERIERLRTNLSESSHLIEEINAELRMQETALQRIRAEAQTNKDLAALYEEQAEAVRSFIAATIETANEKAAKPGRRAHLLLFLAGLLFSVPLGIGVNFLSDLMFH
ncbi:hypothetical protein [Actinophytocola sp.]|uniref:hypothetical protein n=1 Tax=Actinophytocola sp. TaxID=1872138 RepID=UPI002ED57308